MRTTETDDNGLYLFLVGFSEEPDPDPRDRVVLLRDPYDRSYTLRLTGGVLLQYVLTQADTGCIVGILVGFRECSVGGTARWGVEVAEENSVFGVECE